MENIKHKIGIITREATNVEYSLFKFHTNPSSNIDYAVHIWDVAKVHFIKTYVYVPLPICTNSSTQVQHANALLAAQIWDTFVQFNLASEVPTLRQHTS